MTAFRRRFVLGLLWRILLFFLTAFAFVYSLGVEGLGAARLLAGLICIAAISALWRYIQQTNVELARFVDAVRFGDFSQNFTHRNHGAGFGEVGRALEEGMRRLREERHRLTDSNRFYEAVLDDAPIAIITIEGDGRVELANKAARRLLPSHGGIRIDDFREYGDAFARFLETGKAGQSRMVPLMIDAVPQAVIVSAAVVHRLGGAVKAVAVQPIQGELNAVEIAAQSDLVRVLTHEIMNSMTPVTSLAHTAARLMQEADTGGDAKVSDARAAVETLARRADGVMNFVQSYRQISRTPEVRPRSFALLPWARELESLFRAGLTDQPVSFTMTLEPERQSIEADPDLLFQVLINLLRNAADACIGHSEAPAITLGFTRTPAGRTCIEVADNGPGVPEAIRQDVFLPFFTTKAKGSGVGLSLARQIVLAHRGSITLLDGPGGGALFRIVI